MHIYDKMHMFVCINSQQSFGVNITSMQMHRFVCINYVHFKLSDAMPTLFSLFYVKNITIKP